LEVGHLNGEVDGEDGADHRFQLELVVLASLRRCRLRNQMEPIQSPLERVLFQNGVVANADPDSFVGNRVCFVLANEQVRPSA
jgi:hypothetical protein